MTRHTVSMIFSLSMVLNAPQAISATSAVLGAAATQLYNHTDATTDAAPTTQRVRIPLTLKPWNDIDTRSADGKSVKTKIAGRTVAQVLRARIEKSNDFYLGDWRIQTTPIRWLKRSNQYQVKLEVFRRYGEAGQLEETMGSVTLTGILDKQQDGLYMLSGTARRIFRDKQGEPILELDAGQHVPLGKVTTISRLEKR